MTVMKSTPMSVAERQRAYRERKRAGAPPKVKTPPKSGTQRARECRARKKALKAGVSYHNLQSESGECNLIVVSAKRPKSGAQRAREFRARRKALRAGLAQSRTVGQPGVSVNNHQAEPCSLISVKSDLDQPQTEMNDFSFEDRVVSPVSLDIKSEEELEETFELGSECCQALLEENRQLKEEMNRLSKLVDEQQQQLLMFRQKEIKLEQMMQAVKEIVNENVQIETVSVKQEV